MMKKSLLCVSLLLLANVSWADIVITLPTHGVGDPCKTIQGSWSGRGKVRADVIGMPIECTYHGEGYVPYITDSGEVSMDITLTKESGFCPDGENFATHGTCRDGRLILNVEDGSLQGHLSADGRSANVSGYIGVDVLGQHVIATVEDMRLQKK